MLPAGTLSGYLGTIQTDPGKGSGGGSGTGNQLYFGGGSYALTDRLSFGIDLSSYLDPPVNPINGEFPYFAVNTAALWGKYGVYSNGTISVAAQASIESFIRLEFPGGIVGRETGVLIGSLKLPITYRASPHLQFHVTPSVTFFPEYINGVPFYGTVASLGGGVSFQANERLAFYGAVNMPFGPGANTITNTAAFVNTPVWTVGGRYNMTPKFSLDAYLTNGVGVSSATSILSHWPDGDMVLGGVYLSYTPGAKYQESYRGRPAPVTSRQQSLQQDGFTLGSPDTIGPGTFRVGGWYGTNQNRGIALAFSPDRDAEFDVIFEDHADDGSVTPALVPTTELRYMFGPRLRFLDQNNGDAFSASARMLFESGVAGVGVFFLEGLASYKVNERLAISAVPKVAAFRNTEIIGLGVGVNYEVFDGLELIAEATVVGADATDAAWAAGLRYNLPDTGLSIDAHATNAIGRAGIGTMIAQDSTKFSIGLTKRFNVWK